MPYPKNLYFRSLQNMQFIESTMRNSVRVDLKCSCEYKQTDDPFHIPTWSFESWQLKIIYLRKKKISIPFSIHEIFTSGLFFLEKTAAAFCMLYSVQNLLKLSNLYSDVRAVKIYKLQKSSRIKNRTKVFKTQAVTTSEVLITRDFFSLFPRYREDET